jgi:hypothetical protein
LLKRLSRRLWTKRSSASFAHAALRNMALLRRRRFDAAGGSTAFGSEAQARRELAEVKPAG